MSATPGWPTTIKVSGTSTAMLAEATSAIADDSAGRHRRQITNATKRVLDPATALTVKDGGVAVAAANVYSVDYQFGIVTFALGYVIGGAVTFDASYLPLLAVTDARSVDISVERQVIDTTTYDSAVAASGGRRSTPGLLGFTAEMELLDGVDSDLDPGADTLVLHTLLTADTPKLVEVQYAPGYYFRGWATLTGIERSSTPEDVLKKTVKMVGSSQTATSYSDNAYFGFGQ